VSCIGFALLIQKGKFMKKLSFALISAACAVTCMSAAAQQKALTVASFPSFDEAVKVAIPLYKKLHPDVEIKLVSLGYGDHHNAMVSALATGAGLPDVIGVEVGYIGKFAESGALEDLSKAPYNALSYKSKIVPYTFAQATNSAGLLAGMPADIGPGTMIYRKDILDKAGVTEADLTKSWESYIAAGKKIKEKASAFLVPHANSVSDVYIRSNVKSGDGIYFDKADKPLLTTPRFVQAFEYAKAVRDAGLDGKVAAWSNEWSEGFKRNAFATEMRGAWMLGQLSSWLAPDTKGKWRAANLPNGAYASWGGSYYAIPKAIAADHKAMAWDFIKFMTTNKEMQVAAFSGLDAFPALLEAAKDPFVDQPVEFFGGQKARQLWRETAAKIPALKVHKLDSVADEIMNAELTKVLDEGKDIKTALADAQKQVERRMRK
jgi:multiple sugar transport system substrate-binding protein